MRTHRQRLLGICLAVLSVSPCGADAQTATQVVTFSVVSSSQVAMGNVAVVSPTAIRGSRTTAMIAGMTYAVATNERNQKIMASLDAPVPSRLALSVALEAPRGAASRGLRTLSTTPTDVVTGITESDGAALPMRYQWSDSSATPSAALKSRVVIYTITAGL